MREPHARGNARRFPSRVRAALEGDRDAVYRAAVLDRHAASVLSLREIRSMVDDLIAAHGHAMPLGVRQEAMAA